MKVVSIGMLIAATALQGCAGLQFNPEPKDGALNYFDGKPYLFTSTNKDCVSTATVVMIPSERRSVNLKSGYGSADLSVALSNGMIASVGQKTDTKIPETITAVSGAITSVGSLVRPLAANGGSGKVVICKPAAMLFPIMNGVPDMQHGLKVEVLKEIVDLNAGSQ
ncbi:hypothetical protein SAMN02745157_1515 [Kaistia soli DSM 19436]|uniref:Lipoprotein n=1 Tax=Kaistia soli DSM 19436 TaxID=1122133 RepID=A0A1M4YGF3_9HYPH|nr:hypothetical protein [Kaistia soli]SHF04855.1 hypothetical protein SAMN02745157_1515 [Kaistia soli DSM 19436]